ncbi:hypothetical protein GGR58DRAFT_497409 [Xylaria digitata]|nr:hypothetical protein GGR58DRAFT_497409 [Xylaria digitata]
MIKPFSLLLLGALPVPGFGVTLGDFDPLRDLGLKTHTADRDADAYGKTGNVDVERLIEKDADSAKYLPPLTTSPPTEVLTLVEPNRFRDKRDFHHSCKNDRPCSVCFDSFKKCTDGVASSVSPTVSSTVESTPSTGLSSFPAPSSPSSTSSSPSSTSSSPSSTISSPSSTLETASSPVETTSYAAESPSLDNLNKLSRGLNLNAGQLAGIVIGVFLASSISSIFGTLFILQCRKQKATVTHTSIVSPTKPKRQTQGPSFGNLRSNILPLKSFTTATTGHHELPEGFPPWLKQQKSSPNHHVTTLTDRISIPSPVSPESTSDRIYLVSPLSDKSPDTSRRDRSSSWGFGLFRNNTQRSETSNVPPIKFSLARKITQDGPEQIQVVRVGGQETLPRRLFSNMRTPKTFLSNEGSTDSTATREERRTQDSADRMERGTMALAPIATMSALSPPAIPLRFSSLNTSIAPPMKSPADFHGDDGTFLLSTDDELVDRGPRSSQDQSGVESSSFSSIILHDLTQFDPGGPAQQPASRFSMSSAPLSSLGYSVSSTSPAPQYDQQQLEHPELSALRPAPPISPQLQAPVPRRPNSAANQFPLKNMGGS